MAAKDPFHEANVKRIEDLSGNFKIIQQIGRGAFSDVFLATDISTKEEKVIKTLRIDKLEMDRSISMYFKEASIMQQLNHPNIVKFYECFEYMDYICIVCEYCDGGDLTMKLRDTIRKNSYTSSDLIIEWYYKLASAVDYLHENKIIHRDIKSQNIYFKNGEIKLGDFGEANYSIKTVKQHSLTAMVGTPTHMAPEMYLNEKYNFCADIWSLGCVFYEIRYLEQPFHGDSLDELRENILNCKLPLLERIKDEISDLIRNMLCKSYKRLKIKEVLNYKMFDRYRNKQINEKDEKVTHNQNNTTVNRVLNDTEQQINEMKAITINKNDIEFQEGTKNKAEKQNKYDKLKNEVNISESSHIMISYCHKDKDICLKINRDLIKNGFKTWIDVENTFNRLRDAMAHAVENAFVVILCCSENYQKSENCRYEADYAADLKKNIIAVKLENYNASSWLGLLISGKLYVDFSSGKDYFKSLKNLIKQLDYFHKDFQLSHDKGFKRGLVASGDASENPSGWNSKEVENWLITNNLENIAIVLKEYDGAALEELYKMKRDNVNLFYDLIENDIKRSNVEVASAEKLRFYNYLEKLFKFYKASKKMCNLL